MKRIKSIDFARGLALVFVVWIHVLDQLSAEQIRETALAWWVYSIGRIIGAPMFIFLMGVSLSFSSRVGLKDGIKRGVNVLALGYLLNLLRGTLPLWVGLLCGYFTLEQIAPITPAYTFKEVDVLQFAGLCLIVIFLIRKLYNRWFLWLALGAAVILVCDHVKGFQTGFKPIDAVLDLILGDGSHVHFSLFPWMAYPLFGMAYGHFLKAVKNRGAYFLGTSAIGFLLMCACTPSFIADFDNLGRNFHIALFYFRQSPIGVIFYTGMMLLWMGLCYGLVKLLPSMLLSRIYIWSAWVTPFYFIQWLIIGWLDIVMMKLHLGGTIFLMILVLFLTDRFTFLWNRFRNPVDAVDDAPQLS